MRYHTECDPNQNAVERMRYGVRWRAVWFAKEPCEAFQHELEATESDGWSYACESLKNGCFVIACFDESGRSLGYI